MSLPYPQLGIYREWLPHRGGSTPTGSEGQNLYLTGSINTNLALTWSSVVELGLY